MKYIAGVLLLICSVCSFASDYRPYIKVGIGYKISEPTTSVVYGETIPMNYGTKDSARFEFGIEKGNLTFGVSHHSQWLGGWPVDNNPEYFKTEIFIDYKVYLD